MPETLAATPKRRARRKREQRAAFDYALIRVVPRVERGECLNVGVALHCRERGYLGARIAFDPLRLRALAPWLDDATVSELAESLATIPLLCAGGPEAGPLGALSQTERFHWIVAPGSAMIQPSPVHTGLCDDPEAMLEHILATLVQTPGGGGKTDSTLPSPNGQGRKRTSPARG